MKKRLLSMVLAIAIVTLSVFGFAVPTSAINNTVYHLQEAHNEIPLDLLVDNSVVAQDISFTVPYNGFYIIQTFGCTVESYHPYLIHGSNTRMSLKNQSNESLGLAHGQTGKGFERGRLIHCELFTYETYTLHLTFAGAEAAKLVITYAEGQFNQEAPIDNYTDIALFEPGTFEFVFTEDNYRQAQVILVEHNDDNLGPFSVEVDGSSSARVILSDPRSLDDSGSVWLYSDIIVSLDKAVPYYLVVYIDPGDNPADFPIVVTVTFSRVV